MPYIDIDIHSIYDRALGAGGGPATTENIQHLPSQTMAAASQSATSLAQEAGDGDGQNSRGMTRVRYRGLAYTYLSLIHSFRRDC